MSNQVGLMFSFLFLAMFLVLSGEIFAFQQVSAKVISITNDIALYVEKNGNEDVDDYLSKYDNYFDSIKISKEEISNSDLTSYTIETIKTYNGFSTLVDSSNKEITCNVIVCRKE